MLVKEQISIGGILCRIKPPRRIEPEHCFVASGTELIDGSLRCMLKLPKKRSHDEDRYCGWRGTRYQTWVAKTFTVEEGRMFRVRKCADGFDKRYVSCFEASAELEESLIIGALVEVEGCKVRISDI